MARAGGVAGSVEGAGRGCVGELPDGIRDPAPDGHAAVIAGRCELVNARGAFLERLLAVALEHEGGGAPDVDLGNHAARFPRDWPKSDPTADLRRRWSWRAALAPKETLAALFDHLIGASEQRLR